MYTECFHSCIPAEKEKGRIGSDAQLPFGYCNLTLQPAVDPVVTPSGRLYSREAILEHLMTKTEELKRQRAAFEAEERASERKETLLALTAEAAVREELEPRPTKAAKTSAAEKKESLKAPDKPDASFWLPQFTPDAPKPRTAEPPKRPASPVSGNPLRLKDIASIELRRVPDSDPAKYFCHVTNDEITTQPVLFIRSTGCVVLEPVAQKLGVLRDKVCPVTGRKFKDKDVVRLATAHSAYASSGGDALVVTKFRPVGGGA